LKLTKKKHNEKTKKKPWIIVLLILHQGTIKEFNSNKKKLKTSKPLYIRHPLSILIVLKNKKTNLPPNNSRMILYHGKKKIILPPARISSIVLCYRGKFVRTLFSEFRGTITCLPQR
jgi:hypothetical protein